MNWFDFEFSAFLWVFVVLNVVNVVIQTVKSIATIKCGALSAAGINALAYGLYTVVVVYMNADGLGVFWKALITGLANLIGVYVVKIIEKKNRKDRLWKIEVTFAYKESFIDTLVNWARKNQVSYNYNSIGEYYVVNFYAPTQKESLLVKEFIKKYNGKYFASEGKIL